MSIRKRIELAIGVVVGILGLIALSGFESVQTYEGCLLVRNGRIKEEWSPGLHWRFPIMSNVACYRASRTTYEASPGQKGSGAQYNDDAVEARSKDGQKIDAVSFRIAFHVPLVMTGDDGVTIDGDNLRTIYTDVGAKSEEALVSSVVTFYARPEVRTVMQLHTSEELLEGDLGAIGQEIADRLRPRYAAYGVVLEDVLLSKPDFNDEFEAKLQQRQQAAVDVEIEQQRALQAEQQGRARINAANADAEVVAIQAQAEASRTITQAQAEANRTVTEADAQATAIAVLVAAYGGPEGYLRAQQIQAMTGWPVQIIGDGHALPIVPVAQATPVSVP
jgi:regulator of protease activity HflC (stomatin/prohibitin superfamily)